MAASVSAKPLHIANREATLEWTVPTHRNADVLNGSCLFIETDRK